MSELDKKLETICESFYSGMPASHRQGALQAIKQAFIEDGWVVFKPPECLHTFRKVKCDMGHEGEYCDNCRKYQHMSVSDRDMHVPVSIKPFDSTPKMTGQEWYDKFRSNLGGDNNLGRQGFEWLPDVKKAAKKASGIE